MPQLGKYKPLLDIVVLLYPTDEDAREGKNFGGTGFLVGVSFSNIPQFTHFYAVSNWHVACQGSPVVRLNKHAGGFDIFSFGPDEWHFIPGRHDLAVVPIDLDSTVHRVKAIHAENWMALNEEIPEGEISPGDDVFMIGGFIDYGGRESNHPSLRFGNISIVDAEIMEPTGYIGKNYVVDMRSRSGYSGSPVFFYRSTGSIFLESQELAFGHYLSFLGVHWGQFPERWPLVAGAPIPVTGSAASLVWEGKYVKGLSGMSCVCPASALFDLLNAPRIQAMRLEREAGVEAGLAARGLLPPEPERAGPASGAGRLFSASAAEAAAAPIRRADAEPPGSQPGLDDEWHDPAEAARRRDEMLKRTLNMPPNPRKGGKPHAS